MTYPQEVVQVLNTCHTLISCTIVARKVAHNVQLHLDSYVQMNTYINYIHIV